MIRLFTILSVILAINAHTQAAMTAEQVLDAVAANMSRPASATIAFTVTPMGRASTSGTMTVCKRMFTFSAGDMAVWFDGRTQWTLQRRAREVSITEPTSDEVAETNPLSVLSSFKKSYTCKMLSANASTYRISLVPRSKSSSITSATVTVNAKTMLPVSVNATINGTVTAVQVKSFTPGKALAPAYFKYDAKKHPGITVNDLR